MTRSISYPVEVKANDEYCVNPGVLGRRSISMALWQKSSTDELENIAEQGVGSSGKAF
jgi:hypothetical protein